MDDVGIRFAACLHALEAQGCTARSLFADRAALETAAAETLIFLRAGVLRSRSLRARLRLAGETEDSFADAAALHLLQKLDALMACPEPARAAYAVRAAHNLAATLCRRAARAPQPCPDETLFAHLSAKEDAEDALLRKEAQAERRALAHLALALAQDCPRFALTCLLYTKVLGGRTRDLAALFDRRGLLPVSESCFAAAERALALPAGAIRPREQDCELPAYAALPELCDKISHASHNCACKLRRRLRLSSSPIIPAAPTPVNARPRALS